MKQLLISNQQILFFSSALIMRNQEECPITQGRISLAKKITSAQPKAHQMAIFIEWLGKRILQPEIKVEKGIKRQQNKN